MSFSFTIGLLLYSVNLNILVNVLTLSIIHSTLVHSHSRSRVLIFVIYVLTFPPPGLAGMAWCSLSLAKYELLSQAPPPVLPPRRQTGDSSTVSTAERTDWMELDLILYNTAKPWPARQSCFQLSWSGGCQHKWTSGVSDHRRTAMSFCPPLSSNHFSIVEKLSLFSINLNEARF